MHHLPVMSQLNAVNLYPLPYTIPQPPPGLFRNVETVSGCSDTAAFETGLNNRDVFLGRRRCVVCGESGPCTLEHCHIVGRSDIEAVRPCVQLNSRAGPFTLFLVDVAQAIGMGPRGRQRVA